MPQNNKKKICIIVDCLCHGGAEKIAGFLSIELAALGYEVSVISLRNDIKYSYSGHLYNLGLKEPTNKIFKQTKKLIDFRRVVKQTNSNYYIDFRMRNRRLMEFMLHSFVFPSEKMIFTMHNFNLGLHKPKGSFFDRFYRKAYKIVAVSSAIMNKLQTEYNYNNVKLIYNFIEEDLVLKKSELVSEFPMTKPFILAVSRLNNKVKQLDKLITCFKESKLPQEGIKLVILGDGKDKENLENLIRTEGVEDSVNLLGFVENPYVYIRNAHYLVLSSKFEGFPMVLLEALRLGTPVVSFDCPSGPNEIIMNRQNGLLVDNQDFRKLREAIEEMVYEKELYAICKSNTIDSVKRFDTKTIINQWQQLLG